MKAICIKHLQDYVLSFQERRAKVTDAIVDEFMKTRPLEWKGNSKVPRADLVVPVTTAGDENAAKGEDGGAMTKNALKKQAKLEKIAREKAEKAAAKAAKEAAEAS